MSMSDTPMSDLRIDSEMRRPARMNGLLPRAETPIVPKNSIAGRALVAVVAIMTFLSSLTVGAVMLVRSAASEWQSDVSREVTIQVRPSAGRDIEASPDLAQLRRTLTASVPGAILDDHRAWTDRMRTMARTSEIGGIGILLLMLIATVLSVTFATRGAMATNRPIVEVLHFIGARDSYIASQFQRHFLMLGLQGGAAGGGAAMLLFLIAGLAADWGRGTASADQITALFGSFSIGWTGYAVIAAQIVLIALVTALTSRRTVNRTLKTVE